MKLEFIVNKKGNIVTNNLDRQGEKCSNVYRITQNLGDTVSDEETGPECDEVHEGESVG